MPPESPTARCNKCGRPKSVGDKASLTQWIVCCNCVEGAAEEPSQEPVDICGKCKRRISSGRAGSFTQWVFRSDLCSCDVPEAMLPSFDFLEQKNIAEHFDDDAEGLHLEGEPPFPLERYKPLMEVGQGTSGHIYLCKDRLLEKKVAIKCLRAVTPEQLIAFQREAKATSLLNHPGVVSVLDFGGTAGGAPFMVMEYVEGTSLFDYIDERGPLPVDVALTVIRRVAEALAHAHERGVYHRDVKSSNIVLLGGENAVPDVRVIDFGVAGMKQVIDTPSTEQGDTIVGTPAYMSPDQAQGCEYDQRSEIYSLGCVMFETLTGRPPFLGETALETISKHAHEQAPMLGDLDENNEFSNELESLVGRCLEKDPDDRFQNMSELIEAIGSIAPLFSSGSASSVFQNQTATFSIDQSSSISRKGFKWVAIAGGATLCVCFFGLMAFNPNALNQIKTLFSSNPEESERLTKEAWSELASDNNQKAIELSTRAVELDKENFEALDVRGVAYFVNGDTKNALASLNLVIKNPAASQQASSAAHFHRDVIYRSIGKSVPKRTNIPSSYANYVPTPWETKKFSPWIGDEWRLLPVSGPKAKPGAKKHWPKELDPNEEFKETVPANSDENSSSNFGAESGGTVGADSGLDTGSAPGANHGSTSGLNSGGNAHLNSTSEDAGMLPEVRAVMKAEGVPPGPDAARFRTAGFPNQRPMRPPGPGGRGLGLTETGRPGFGPPGAGPPGAGGHGLGRTGTGRPGFAPPGTGPEGAGPPGLRPPRLGPPGMTPPGINPSGESDPNFSPDGSNPFELATDDDREAPEFDGISNFNYAEPNRVRVSALASGRDIDKIIKNPRIDYLTFSNVPISPAVLSKIRILPLKALVLQNYRANDKDLEFLGDFKKLDEFVLSSGMGTGSFLEKLNPASMRILELKAMPNFNQGGLDYVRKFKRLHRFSINSMPLIGNSQIKVAADVAEIEELTFTPRYNKNPVYHCKSRELAAIPKGKIDNYDVAALRKIVSRSTLRRITLDSDGLTDDAYSVLGRGAFRELVLQGSAKIKTENFRRLSKNKLLTRIILCGDIINEQSAAGLVDIRSLYELTLFYTCLSREFFERLSNTSAKSLVIVSESLDSQNFQNLATLHSFKHMRIVDQQFRLTTSDVLQLKKKLPKCKIELKDQP